MGRKRNIIQMKTTTTQEKSPGKKLNKMEASNVSDIEFKTMIIKVLKGIKMT